MNLNFSKKDSFTLIELLVVIAILAILSVAVVLVINPADIIKQSRDSQRLTDLNNLNKALAVFDVTNPDDFTGTSTVVYVSLPVATEGTCPGLPALPGGYTYRCVTSSTLAKADGTGWIPVNFQNISYGSPLNKLPVDPTNSSTTGQYYTYIMGGSWALSAQAESDRNRGINNKAGNDGGRSFVSFEFGSNLNLTPLVLLDGGGRDPDLIAYYPLTDAAGTTASDISGNAYNGTITAGAGGWTTNQQNSSGSAYDFDGTATKVTITDNDDLSFGDGSNDNPFSISLWIKADAFGTVNLVSKYTSPTEYNFGIESSMLYFYLRDESLSSYLGRHGASLSGREGTWLYLTATYDGRGGNEARQGMDIYLNGAVADTGNSAQTSPTYIAMENTASDLIIGSRGVSNFFNGAISDVRIYNRALSTAEISAIYNSTR